MDDQAARRLLEQLACDPRTLIGAGVVAVSERTLQVMVQGELMLCSADRAYIGADRVPTVVSGHYYLTASNYSTYLAQRGRM